MRWLRLLGVCIGVLFVAACVFWFGWVRNPHAATLRLDSEAVLGAAPRRLVIHDVTVVDVETGSLRGRSSARVGSSHRECSAPGTC